MQPNCAWANRQGERARGPLAVENSQGRASGGGKLTVNGLRWVAGDEGGQPRICA